MILLIRCLQPPQQVAPLQGHRNELVSVPFEDRAVGNVASHDFASPSHPEKRNPQLDGIADLVISHRSSSLRWRSSVVTYATPKPPGRQAACTITPLS